MAAGKPQFAISDDAKRSLTAGQMFRGSREYLYASQLLCLQRQSPEVLAHRAPWPLQPYVTCVSLSLELALKCRITLDGKNPPKTHSSAKLFGVLSQKAQQDAVSGLLVDGIPATPASILEVLREFEGTFENWRYLHESLSKCNGSGTVFHEGNMVNLIASLFDSIVRLRPDFGPWPGVIVDPSRPVPWHLTPR